MKIEINDLEFEAIIGIFDFERDRVQKVKLNITIEYEYTSSNYFDYTKVIEVSKKHIIENRYKLLEEALVGLHKTLTKTFYEIDRLQISISKPDILPDCVVGLTL